jgi:hypothetical protein
VKLRRQSDETKEVVVEAAKDEELREHLAAAAREVMDAYGRLRTVRRRHEVRRYATALGLFAGAVAGAAVLWRTRRHHDATRPDMAFPATPQWNGQAEPATPAAGSPSARPVAPEAFRAESPDTQVGPPPEAVEELLERKGQPVEDISGEKIGSLRDIYLDDPTGAPEWAVVASGTVRTSARFVPLRGARMLEGRIQVAYTRQLVTEAPQMDADGRLSPTEEHELYHHYGVNRQEAFKVS